MTAERLKLQFHCPGPIAVRLNENDILDCLDTVTWQNNIDPETNKPYTHFLVQFGHVDGNFILRSATDLQTLSGSPTSIDGTLEIHDAFALRDFDGGPDIVNNLACKNCFFVTLENSPLIKRNCSLVNIPELRTLEHLNAPDLRYLQLINCPALKGLASMPDLPNVTVSTNNPKIFTAEGWPKPDCRTTEIQFTGVPVIKPNRDWWLAFLQAPRALLFAPSQFGAHIPEWCEWLNQYRKDQDYLNLLARVNEDLGADQLITTTTTCQEITEKLDVNL